MCHSENCLNIRAAYQRECDKFESEFPNYCRQCRGNGGFWYSYDPSPSGVSLAAGSMSDFEPCEDCIGLGICPQCGSGLPDDEHWICPGCDWDFDNPRPGLPDPSIMACDCCSDCTKDECDLPDVYREFSDLYEVN